MRRITIFGIIAALCVAISAWAVWRAAQPADETAPASTAAVTTGSPPPPRAPDRPPARPYALGLSISPGFYGLRGTAAALNSPAADQRLLTELSCERISFDGGAGICLERGVLDLTSRVTATVFGPDFKARYSVPIDARRRAGHVWQDRCGRGAARRHVGRQRRRLGQTAAVGREPAIGRHRAVMRRIAGCLH